MARAYVFLVHGVGRHPLETWADPWKAALIRELQRYAPYHEMSAEEIERDAIAFVPVGYDSVFEGFRTRWGDLAGALASADVGGSRGLQKAIQWVAEHDDGDGIAQVFWDKVLDALLWALFPIARARVISVVNRGLVDGLVAMGEENDGAHDAHVVAHSLGTSVVHDATISLKAAGELHGGSLDASRFKWNSLFMVANTSRLLEPWVDLSDDVDTDAFKVYTSNIQPGLRNSVCRSYFNVRHVIDPITWPRRFDPKNWPDNAYLEIGVTRFDDLKDVHSFEDYVADPGVHLRLFRKVLGNSRLGSSAEITKSITAYERDFPLQASIEFDNLRQLLGGDFEKRLGGRELVSYLIQVYKEVRG